MALDPGALRPRLVLLVGGIVVPARALPSPPAFALASRQGAVALAGALCTRMECLATGNAAFALHGRISGRRTIHTASAINLAGDKCAASRVRFLARRPTFNSVGQFGERQAGQIE
jgi:hypothetical protein